MSVDLHNRAGLGQLGQETRIVVMVGRSIQYINEYIKKLKQNFIILVKKLLRIVFCKGSIKIYFPIFISIY